MSFRWKIFLGIAVSVAAVVWLVVFLVSSSLTQVFEAREKRLTATLSAQFEREFARRGRELQARLKALASTQRVLEIPGQTDYAPLVDAAGALSEGLGFDFFEIVATDGSIISSAHWPARFGYKEDWILQPNRSGKPFVRLEELPNQSKQLALFAVERAFSGSNYVLLAGGVRLDESFLENIALPDGMAVSLNRQSLPDGAAVTPFPLKDNAGVELASIYLGQSRKELDVLQDAVRQAGYRIGGIGVFLGALFSLWFSSSVSRPLRRLAETVQRVALGDWDARATETSSDEVGRLATDFNSMTEQLAGQKSRMIQAERVAAWRELARRLAHELKNPLFPLQLTVENLRRSREAKPEVFNEVFEESTRTLLAELDELKTIIGRFSDFARMPAPTFEPVDINQIVQEVVRVPMSEQVTVKLELGERLPMVDGDPEQLRRALRNLALNAMDVMPNGGTLTLRTSLATGGRVRVEVSDTGQGLTPEECSRLFTPYYTTKQHGTGLGLAIVQSVISDHRGTIAVESEPGKGSTFRLELNRYEQIAARG